jgi:hypothetical protein
MQSACFLHVPKTSGTSVMLYLESQFTATETCPARTADEYRALGAAALARHRLYRAECDASVLDLLPPAIPVVTVLRHPLDRAFSHWRYIGRLPEHRLHEQFQRGHGTFQEFFATMPPNPMARLLAARGGDTSPRSVWEDREPWRDDELLERALARLDSFAVVGVTERHDDTLAAIADHFGWAPPTDLPRTNAAPASLAGARHAGPRPADARRFAVSNAVDLALYEHAAERLARWVRVHDATDRQARYERRLGADTRDLTRRTVVDLCGPVQGSGWLKVVDTERGPMRPLGSGGCATLDLPLRLGRFTKLELTVPAVASEAALASLAVTANGTALSLSPRPVADGVTVHAVLPPSEAGDRFTRIEISCRGGVAVPPNHTGAANDLRASLAVRRLELIPYDPRQLGRARSAAHRGARSAEQRPAGPPRVVPMRRAARFFWTHSPAWTFDADLQRRLDALELWDRVEELQRDGFTVIPDVIDPDLVTSARASIRRLAATSAHRTRSRDVMQPLAVDPLFVDLLLHPVQLALADAVCGKAMLDSQAGLVRDRTSNPQGLHAENALWLPAPYPEHHYLCSAMLTLDRFDRDTGGTCFVAGSHLTRRDPTPADSLTLAGVVTPEVDPGSLIVWLGGTWHGAHQRTAAGERVGLLTIFTRPSLRPAQDVRSLPDALVRTEELRVRLRRADPFEQQGWYDGDADAMLHWIRNTPRPDAVTCEWDETLTGAARATAPVGG